MNLQELRETAIAQVVSLTMTDQLVNVNETFVNSMINKAYHRVERRALWKFSESEAPISATPNTRACSDVPADLAIPLMVYSDRLSAPLEYHDERQKFLSLGATGTVQMYGMWNDELRFYPLPTQNETFTLRYYKTWVDLADDLDEPIIPDTWHTLLTDFASGQLALRLPPTGDRFLPYSKAEPYLQAFESGLQEMLNSDLVLPTWDAVPNYGFTDQVLELQEW